MTSVGEWATEKVRKAYTSLRNRSTNLFLDAPFQVATREAPGKLDLSKYGVTKGYQPNKNHEAREQNARSELYAVLRLFDIRAPNYRGKLPEPVGCVPDTLTDEVFAEFRSEGNSLPEVLRKIRNEFKRGTDGFDVGRHEALACMLQRVTHVLAFIPRKYTKQEREMGLEEFYTTNPLHLPSDEVRLPPFIAMRANWCDDAPLAVNLGRALNDIIVGLFALNPLRREIPNFTYYYGYQMLDDVRVATSVPYVLEQAFFEGTSVPLLDFADMAKSDDRVSLYLVLLQLFFALAHAFKRVGFVHNDLHADKVRVLKLDAPRTLYYRVNGVKLAMDTRYIPIITDYTCAHVNLPVTREFASRVAYMFHDDVAFELLDGQTLHTGVLNYATNVAPSNPRPLTDICRLVSSFAASTMYSPELAAVSDWMLAPLFGGKAPRQSNVVSLWDSRARGAAPPGVDIDPGVYALYLVGSAPREVKALVERGSKVASYFYPWDDGGVEREISAISPRLAASTKVASVPIPMVETVKDFDQRPIGAGVRQDKRCTFSATRDTERVKRAIEEGERAYENLTRHTKWGSSGVFERALSAAIVPADDTTEAEIALVNLQDAEVVAEVLVDVEYAFGPIDQPDVGHPTPAVELLLAVRTLIDKISEAIGE